MNRKFAAAFLILALSSCSAPPRLDDRLPARWAGANAFELWARSDSEIASALDVMAGHRLRVLRVCILRSFDPDRPFADVEEPLGIWHDAILERIDYLLAQAELRRVRVIVALRDCRTRTDAYSKLHPGTAFYSDPVARAAYRRRIEHVLHYQGPHTKRVWSELGPVLYAWDIGNRTEWRAAPDWIEDMAAYVKMVSPKQRVALGGLELVTVGDTATDVMVASTSVDLWGYQMDSKEPLAKAADVLSGTLQPRKKDWILLEFGAPKADLAKLRKVVEEAIGVANKHQVPWLFTSLGRDRHEASTDQWPGDLIFDAILAPAVP